MDVLTAIRTRRSVRAYTETPVSDEHLDILLRAAMAAPNSDNAQPWHFIVTRDTAKLQAVADVNKWAAMAPKASVGIVPCAELSLEVTPGSWMMDCSAAVQNMLLAAVDLGLGAVWTGVYPDRHVIDGVKSIFGLPEGIEPHCVVLVGHPAQSPKPKDRFKPERIHLETW